MKRLAAITSALFLASTPYSFPNKTFNQIRAQEENQEDRFNKELADKSKTLKDLILSKEKGDRLVIEDKFGKSVLTRFVYENKGYVVCVNKSDKEEALVILIHSLWHGRGHYVGILDEKNILSSGYSTFYIADENEKLIPEDITGRLPNHKLIQIRNYNSEKEETHNEKDYFLAELDKNLDVLLDFYTEE